MYDPLPPVIESVYVGPKFLGAWRKHWPRTNGDRPSMFGGTTYFCPKCNDIWARRIVQAEAAHPEIADYLDPRVESRRCEKHGDGSLVTGEYEWSHLLDPTAGDYYPLNWLAYELFLIVRRYP